MMAILAGLLYLVSFVVSVLILIHAFQASVGQGLLCLCIPFYILYYAFARFQHPKKNLLLIAWLVCGLLGSGLYSASMAAEFGAL